MPLKYTWSRTVIAGDPQPYDYSCRDGERGVGRVYRHHKTGWFWTMNAHGVDHSKWATSGVVDSKDEAAAMVERCYEACKAG